MNATTVGNRAHVVPLATRDLIEHARRRVPFYASHLDGYGEDSPLSALPTFHKAMTAGFGRFPISVDGGAGAHRVLATSGTTGDRLFVGLGRGDWSGTADWLGRCAERVGFGPRDTLLNTHCYGMWVGGPALDLLADRSGARLVPFGPVAPTLVLDLLAAGVGTGISATPSYLRRLVEVADETGLDLRSTGLRFGFIGAEPAEPALRRKLTSYLPDGFHWVELFGLTETAGPAVACAPDPQRPALELNTDLFHTEVLEPNVDQAVGVNEVGELTLTRRDPDSSTPLIRYRTRDLVTLLSEDERGATRVSSIHGRADDAVKIGGVLMYPSSVADIVTAILPATAEWGAVVRRRGDDLELVLRLQADAQTCDLVRRSFQERVGLDVTAVATPAEEFVRSREKTRRTVFEIGPSQRQTRTLQTDITRGTSVRT